MSALILLVEDEPLVAAITGALIEDFGHRVVEVNSGADALAALETDLQPDLIITDQNMHGMTGVQLAGHVRVRYPDIPIILASGNEDLIDHPGFDLPVVSKPYDPDRLEREINRLIDSHG
jgi:CheY-like chemotaxis protein